MFFGMRLITCYPQCLHYKVKKMMPNVLVWVTVDVMDGRGWSFFISVFKHPLLQFLNALYESKTEMNNSPGNKKFKL